jgi:hypothetical protein
VVAPPLHGRVVLGPRHRAVVVAGSLSVGHRAPPGSRLFATQVASQRFRTRRRRRALRPGSFRPLSWCKPSALRLGPSRLGRGGFSVLSLPPHC